MSKILKHISLVLFILFSFKSSILAIDCVYPDASLTITYDENGSNINSDFIKSKYYFNSLLIGTSSDSKATNEIEIDQTLWEKYRGVACPSGMKVCTTTKYAAINLPTLKSLGAGIADGFVNSIMMADHISDDVKSTLGDAAYNLLEVDERKLYVLTKEEYDDSEVSHYSDGVNITSSFRDYAEGAWNVCGGSNEGVGWKIWGSVCVIFGEVGGTAIDLIAGDLEVIGIVDRQCKDVTYNGPYASFNVNCGQLMNKMVQYLENVNTYKNCAGDNDLCKSKAITDINKTEENIKSQCTSILKNHDFEGVQKECIENCLNMKDILNGYRQGTDLYDDGKGNSGQCGFSTRLLLWVVNIMKWVKYIVPVLVIVLGILDFIKAIASDKDDEMKKAQGRFVKRLIAAALIFIVPFIIEFVLDKMGFVANGCGVISL